LRPGPIEELLLLVFGKVVVAIVALALVAIGLVTAAAAWWVALALFVGVALYVGHRAQRFRCKSCGVEFPRGFLERHTRTSADG
jgi:uncharacterized membrane protein YphA (DoxX/SURF4 family)